MPTFKCIHPLSGVSPLFTHGTPENMVANFIINCRKTRVNTLKSEYSIQTCIHSLIFDREGLYFCSITFGCVCYVVSSLCSPLEGLRAVALLTLCFKLCERFAQVNALYYRVSHEKYSLEWTRHLLVVHGIHDKP